MRISSDAHEKMMSLYQLTQGVTLSVDTFEHLHVILKGIHPKLDEKLEICSGALRTLQKIQSVDVITLTAEGLPEDTEEKRKRKKALIFFISSIKNLKSEIQRIDAEFAQANKNGNSADSQTRAWGRILGFAKGPFGIATLIALCIVGFLVWQKNTSLVSKRTDLTMQVILYNGKQIPLTQLYIGHGADCDSPHYHAVTGKITTRDGVVIPDPENCGYGKVKNVQVMTVTISPIP